MKRYLRYGGRSVFEGGRKRLAVPASDFVEVPVAVALKPNKVCTSSTSFQQLLP